MLSLGLGLTAGYGQNEKKETKTEPQKEEQKAVSTNEVAIIKTSAGEMTVEFWSDVAPKTVENFKTLAKKGFYDGTAFHRIIKGFMIQGGDPLTKDPKTEDRWGTGDPGYKIKAEFNDRSHTKGVLSMARSANPDSAGSQFFICLGKHPHLDRNYTAFGKTADAESMATVKAIGEVPTGRNDQPTEPVKIQKVAVTEKPK